MEYNMFGKLAKRNYPTVANHNEREDFLTLRSGINELFDSFFNFDERNSMAQLEPTFTHMPVVDVTETEKGFKFKFELPGLSAEDIDVTLEDSTLTVKGEKKEEREEKTEEYISQERSYGRFRRSFALPERVEVEEAKAEFDKGVLLISVPKSKDIAKKARKLEIK
jgi:HSP20 family protein